MLGFLPLLSPKYDRTMLQLIILILPLTHGSSNIKGRGLVNDICKKKQSPFCTSKSVITDLCVCVYK